MMAGFLLMIFFFFFTAADSSYESILGDKQGNNPPNARFALEAWNACNEVGEEAPTGSPRMADCADIQCNENGFCHAIQRVKDSDNSLKSGAAPDYYAGEKEKHLGALCERTDNNITWYFWKIMVKNMNSDTNTGKCPVNGRTQFPCFGSGCMNQPLMYRNPSRLVDIYGNGSSSLTGEFYGTYDVNDDTSNGINIGVDNSYFSVSWVNTRAVSFKLQTSATYPRLKLLLRADAANGINAGYPHDGRGIMKASSLLQGNFTVRLTLLILQGGGEGSQFYLTEIGGCLKNNGNPCDGNPTTDVTRYIQMIINPKTPSVCRYDSLEACPPYHVNTTTGNVIYKNESNFPFAAYYLYCAPWNAHHLEGNIDVCDLYTNPQEQELTQLLPHPEWYVYGYPNSTDYVGWEDEINPKTWELDAGSLSQRLYFYQDPITNATKPPKQPIGWTSINVGTKMYYLDSTVAVGQFAQWTVIDFDVVVPKSK